MSDEQWPKYYTTNTPGTMVAFVKRTSTTAYTVVFKDGTEEPITCRKWEAIDDERRQLTEAEAMAMLDPKPEPQPKMEFVGILSFDPATGEYSRNPYQKPALTVFIIVEVMKCDYGTQESILEVKSTKELADVRILELEAEIKDGYKPKYKYPVSWYVVDREVDSSGEVK